MPRERVRCFWTKTRDGFPIRIPVPAKQLRLISTGPHPGHVTRKKVAFLVAWARITIEAMIAPTIEHLKQFQADGHKVELVFRPGTNGTFYPGAHGANKRFPTGQHFVEVNYDPP